MRIALLAAAVALLAGCDPFVAQVDEPSACTTLTSRTFIAQPGGYGAVIPFDVSLGGALARDETADTEVQLVSISLEPRDGSDLGFVTGAQVQVLPGGPGAVSNSGVVASAPTAPQSQNGSLSIQGSGADLYPQLAAGAAELAVSLQGSGPMQTFTADVTACVHISTKVQYLQ